MVLSVEVTGTDHPYLIDVLLHVHTRECLTACAVQIPSGCITDL